MYICICNAVTDKEIQQAVDLGAETFKEVSDSLGVGTCCGKCKEAAGHVIKLQLIKQQTVENAN